MSQIQSMRYKLKKFWPLRSMFSTRYVSSEHGRHSGPKRESQLPPWIKVPQPYENPDLLKDIHSNAAAFWAEYKPDVLMDHFERRVKPFLIPRCLFLDRSISDPEVLKLHMMNKHFLGHYPLYTTAITLMERMALLNTDHQNHLLEMLASERVMVFNEWKLRLAPIECLFLDHGTQLAPQSSSTDLCTYKMESDASYHAKSKTATLAGLIWKLGILIDIQVNWGLPCRSCGEAECLGVYSVLIRGRGDLKDEDGVDLLIKKTEVVTDRKYNAQVLSGVRDLDPEYPGLCMAVLQIAKQYDVCVFRWAKRETMPLVDDLTRLKYSQGVDVEEVIERHSSKLWGCPIFRIRAEDNKNKTKDAFARWATKEIEFPKRAYIKAEGYREKLDAVVGLLSVLEAPFVIVLVESRETAAKIVAAINKYKCHVLDSECKFDQTSSVYNWCPKQFKALVLVNESNIPPFAAQKALLLVFDKPSNPITYSQSQDSPGVLMITFGAPGPEDTSQDKEVDPTLYGFFRTYEPDKKPQETFKIMTYNLCGKEDGSLKERFFALEDIVKEHDPDFICFQSITTKLHTQLQKHEWWKEYFCSIHLPNVGVASNYLMQMSKLPATFLSIPCSTMREFSTAAVTVKDGGNLERKLLLATCNLEGKNSATKTRQAQELFAKLAKDNELMKHQDVVVCGGMCWNDRIEGKFPLAEGWTDAWEETRKDEEGFTCQLSGNPARADRIVCKVPGYNVEKIDLVGNETGISDHLGLVVRISLKHK